MPKIHSQAQARYFGAMIGGAARNPKGKKMSDSALRKSLRGKKVSKLPKRSRKG
jgi:hypothetical protein